MYNVSPDLMMNDQAPISFIVSRMDDLSDVAINHSFNTWLFNIITRLRTENLIKLDPL